MAATEADLEPGCDVKVLLHVGAQHLIDANLPDCCKACVLVQNVVLQQQAAVVPYAEELFCAMDTMLLPVLTPVILCTVNKSTTMVLTHACWALKKNRNDAIDTCITSLYNSDASKT